MNNRQIKLVEEVISNSMYLKPESQLNWVFLDKIRSVFLKYFNIGFHRHLLKFVNPKSGGKEIFILVLNFRDEIF